MKREIVAMVYSKGKKRAGKGFSEEELKAANLTIGEALKLKIPVDKRRKTKYEENIEALKKYLAQKRQENLRAGK